jgi:ATP-binding cassette subfamily B protein/subfamily B ATP-binding cassette protein MsbA
MPDAPRSRLSRARFRAYLARKRETAGAEERKRIARGRGAFTLLREFLRLLRPWRGPIAAALASLTFATILSLAPPAATKLAIDYVFSDRPLPEWLAGPLAPLGVGNDRFRLLVVIALALVAIAPIRIGLGLASRWTTTRITKRVQVEVRRKVFAHAVRLPLYRVQELRSGGVASMLREDAGGVAELVFSLVYNPWRAAIQLVGSLAILAATDWRLLLGAVVLLPVVWFSHRTWIGRIRPLHRDLRQTRTDVDSHATESFGGARVVRGFGRQRSELGRFTRGNGLLARQEVLTWWWSRGIEIAWELLIPVASAGLLLYGGHQVLAGSLTTGDLVMFLTYLVLLLVPIEALAMSATQFQTNLAALDRTLDLLAEPVEMPDRPGAKAIDRPAVRGRIAFEGVSYRYPKSGQEVLHDISLVAEPGTMVALVGPSGAGKTTLTNLVARFDDPSDGRVTLDGTDLREYSLDGYRSLLGIVEQDIFLFDGTIAENIAYGRRGATAAEITRAAAAAHADEFITGLEKGYATVVGERGVRLSGGQRQRLAIARAILADPRILILDEATSNLDTESERLIQRSLAELMRGRTSFVIAHRLSTIVHADRIVVLERGRVRAIGRHDELIESDERYRAMVAAQTAPPPEPRPESRPDARSGSTSTTSSPAIA